MLQTLSHSTNGEGPLAYLQKVISDGTAGDMLRSLSASGALHLACQIGGQRNEFSAGSDVKWLEDHHFNVGCIAKNFTSLLLAVAVSEGLVAYEDSVDAFFPDIGGIDRNLKFFHLLNHSHGLDDGLLDRMPITSDGRIGAKTIWTKLQATPVIAPPGTLFYYYSRVGFWLAGSILESIYRVSFEALLKNKLGIEMPSHSGQVVCPASGACVTRDELLRIGDFHLREHNDKSLAMAVGQLRTKFRVELPSWPPIADSATPGWFCFGSSVSMTGNRRDDSTLLLLSPEERAVVVLTGRGRRSFHLARSVLFRSIFSSRGLRAPRPLTNMERVSLNPSRIVGTYYRSDFVLDIRCVKPEEVQVLMYRNEPGSGVHSTPFISKTLVPAMEDTYYLISPEPAMLPYIKFRQSASDGRFLYADTGKHIFRRVR